MNALSGTERSRRSRSKKAANDFSTAYLKGSNIATPDDFIEAKEAQFQSENNVVITQFDQGLINEFYTQLKEYSPEDDLYITDELMEAWSRAEKEI